MTPVTLYRAQTALLVTALAVLVESIRSSQGLFPRRFVAFSARSRLGLLIFHVMMAVLARNAVPRLCRVLLVVEENISPNVPQNHPDRLLRGFIGIGRIGYHSHKEKSRGQNISGFELCCGSHGQFLSMPFPKVQSESTVSKNLRRTRNPI